MADTSDDTGGNAPEGEDEVLFPPRPEVLERIMQSRSATTSRASYEAILESQCGSADDSQPIEQYDGTLGVSTKFAATHERPVGQLQWNANLADVYDNPGNVSNVRWCTGTLITHDLFLTAGHCFDENPNNWTVPRINGTNTPIPPSEIATIQHVNFNFQDDPNGNPRAESQFAIEELIEYRLDGLDFAIVRLKGSPGARFGIGKIASRDPSIGEMMAIIGHPAGVPKRIEAGPVTEFQGHRIRYNDIDTLGGNSGSAIWHSPSGRIVGVHTNGGCNRDGTGSNFGVRISRIRQASPTIRRLDQYPVPLGTGRHKVMQESSGRFLDAHESADNDFSVVTRPNQNNNTQRWYFKPVGMVCKINQVSSDRFVDAHQNADNDFDVVSRTEQDNDTQKWVLLPEPGDLSTYRIQQLSSGRYWDAHETGGNDFKIVTRTRQKNDTQRWKLCEEEDGVFTIRQAVNSRYADAHQNSANDYSLVTRAAQNNDTQRWRATTVGMVYEIEQVSSSRHMDAHESDANDFSAVTRSTQGNDSQRWIVTYLGGERYRLQQLVNGRYMDAREHQEADFSVVTRDFQNNATQRWIIS